MTRVGCSTFLIENRQRPYFAKPVKKLLWFFPEGLIAQGRSFKRPWFTVTIKAVDEPPSASDRGRRFFSKEPGITALSVKIKPGAPPPLVMGFHEHEPTILFDMRETADNDLTHPEDSHKPPGPPVTPTGTR